MNYKLQILMMMSLTSFTYATDTTNSHITNDGIGETYISGETFTNKKIYYNIQDNLAIFEGDILLGTVDEVEVWREAEEDNTSSEDNNTANAQIRNGARYRWPNAIIPYTIASNVSSVTRNRISRAMQHISAHTAIRFVQRTYSHPNYVNINSNINACYSNIGNLQRGAQTVNVYEGCGYGSIIHELTHTIGLWHEQSRIDRNKYVRINWNNIKSQAKHNFNQHISDGVDVGHYDYNSLMHYGAYDFSINGQPTITPLQSNVHIGQRNGLSQGDIAAIRAMYGNGGGGSNTTTSWTTGTYSNNQDISKTLSISGAQSLQVRVTGETESGYDHIYIYNASGQLIKTLHGNINTTFTVTGSSIRARLKSDYSIVKKGVTVSISKATGGGGGSSTGKYYGFNSNKNAEGWTYQNLSQYYGGPYNGTWYFAARYNDPKLISPALNLNANSIKKIVIRMANDHTHPYYSKLQVFWRKSGQGYSEYNSKVISVTNHGGWSTYTIDMSNNYKWNGTIREIRIDPLTRGDGHWIAIDYIRFQ